MALTQTTARTLGVVLRSISCAAILALAARPRRSWMDHFFRWYGLLKHIPSLLDLIIHERTLISDQFLSAS